MMVLLTDGTNTLPLGHCSRNEFKKIFPAPRFEWRDLAPYVFLSGLSGCNAKSFYRYKTRKTLSGLLSGSVRICPTLSGRTRTNPDTYPDAKNAVFSTYKHSTDYPDESGQTRARGRARVTETMGDRNEFE